MLKRHDSAIFLNSKIVQSSSNYSIIHLRKRKARVTNATGIYFTKRIAFRKMNHFPKCHVKLSAKFNANTNNYHASLKISRIFLQRAHDSK